MAKMKVAQVPKAGGNIEIVEREIPSAGAGQVRIKVQACGICFSDHLLKDGLWPGLQFPRVPGHEVAGGGGEGGPGGTSGGKGGRRGRCGGAVGRGPENGALAKKLGAHHYIDSKAAHAAEELKKLGGARVILATAPSSKAMTEIFGGLGRNGTLLVVGADMAPLEIPGAALINGRKRVQGWASGTPSDSAYTLRFPALTGVGAQSERFPLGKG